MGCQHPIDVAVLADYWLAVLAGPEEEAVEEHLLALRPVRGAAARSDCAGRGGSPLARDGVYGWW